MCPGDTAPPLVVDIDGTMTRAAGPGLDPRVFDPLREWPERVVVATGKAFPYPVALCDFIGIDHAIVAENGGVVYADGHLTHLGDGEAAYEVLDDFEAGGHDHGWGPVDLVNRWRETEVAIDLDAPREPLEDLAAARGQEVVDTGYAYHVKEPSMSKGRGVEAIAGMLGIALEDIVAIGDSENDASVFERVGRSFAVANADDRAREAADESTKGAHADGLLEALDRVRDADPGD